MTVREPLLPLSWVTREDGVLRLQLHLSDDDAEAAPAGRLLRLREVALGAVTEPVPVVTTGDPRLVTAELASPDVVNGIWQLELADDEDDFEPVHARVLVCDPNPIALLLGPTPQPPRPPAAGNHRTAGTARPTRQVVGALSGAVDRVLVELPPTRARALRDAARRTARRLVR